MRTIDRIRMYLTEQRREGVIGPGTRLPTYHELMKIGEGSYATVRSAMARLQEEGVVEIQNGNGTFLAGGVPLKVRLNIIPTALSEKRMRQLLESHLASRDLRIELEIGDAADLVEPACWQRQLREERAVISMLGPEEMTHLPSAVLRNFDDYREVCRELATEGRRPDVALPFVSYTYQMGISRSLLRRIGFDPQRIDSSFDWWREYAACCREHGLHPASMHWHPSTTWRFREWYGLLLALMDYEPEKFQDGSALFDSAAGRRFLEIIGDTYFYPVAPDPGSFFGRGAGMSFYTGSWIRTQNWNPERPDIAVEDLATIPFSRHGRRIYPTGMTHLEAYLAEGLKTEERLRLWQLMKLLVSREFQLDYCNLTGMISVRKDIRPEEYLWNRDERWNSFIPGPDDLLVPEDSLFSPRAGAALTVLLEDFRLYGADPEITLRRMDRKKTLENEKDPSLQYFILE